MLGVSCLLVDCGIVRTTCMHAIAITHIVEGLVCQVFEEREKLGEKGRQGGGGRGWVYV